MKITAAIVLGIILVGMIAVTTIASAGYIGATTGSDKGPSSPDTGNGMMSGGMMNGGMMGGYRYAETNGSACPHMDSDDIGLNGTAHPCMG